MSAIASPVFRVIIILFLGFIVSRYFEIHKKTISKLVINIFSPALILKGIYSSNIGFMESAFLLGTYLLYTLILILFSVLVHYVLRLGKENRSTFILCTMLSNVGNFGIPIVVFTFGEKALGTAVIFFVLGNILTNTAGIYIASNTLQNPLNSLKNVIKTPTLYAAILALIINSIQITIPDIILQPIELLAHASIPLMLVLLGTQLHHFKVLKNLKLIVSISIIKLIVAPIIAFFVVTKMIILPFDIAQIFILQMSMPTAVFAIVLVEEFGYNSNIVASITTLTTVLSILTVPILTFFLVG